jgi:hypothetical protein
LGVPGVAEQTGKLVKTDIFQQYVPRALLVQVPKTRNREEQRTKANGTTALI